MAEIWTVTYMYSSGEDVYVCASEEIALQRACAIIASNIDNMPADNSERLDVLDLIAATAYRPAIECWADHHVHSSAPYESIQTEVTELEACAPDLDRIVADAKLSIESEAQP